MTSPDASDRASIGAKFGFSVETSERLLQGDTAEELEASAEKLRALIDEERAGPEGVDPQAELARRAVAHAEKQYAEGGRNAAELVALAMPKDQGQGDWFIDSPPDPTDSDAGGFDGGVREPAPAPKTREDIEQSHNADLLRSLLETEQ